MKTLRSLASKLAKMEGKKHQASIGDIREILKCLVIIGCEDKEYLDAIYEAAVALGNKKVKVKK